MEGLEEINKGEQGEEKVHSQEHVTALPSKFGTSNQGDGFIPWELIQFNPLNFNSISREDFLMLAQSIKEESLSHPLELMVKGNSSFILLDGEKRCLALQHILHRKGLSKGEYVIMPFDEERLLQNVRASNTKGREKNPVRYARAIKKEMEVLKLNQAEYAERIGMSGSYLSEILSILKLPEEILEKAENRWIFNMETQVLEPEPFKFTIRTLIEMHRFQRFLKKEELVKIAELIESDKITNLTNLSISEVKEILGGGMEESSARRSSPLEPGKYYHPKVLRKKGQRLLKESLKPQDVPAPTAYEKYEIISFTLTLSLTKKAKERSKALGFKRIQEYIQWVIKKDLEANV